MDWYATLKEWFEHSEEDSKMVIDDVWEVKDHPELKNGLLVSHPNIPFSVGVHIKEDLIHLIVYTSIKTSELPLEDKVVIYRDLLIMNDETNFIKFILIGRYDIVALRSDIDPQYLNKAEFNNNLNHIIVAGNWLLSKITPTEEEAQKMQDMMVETLKMGVQAELDRGTPKEEVVKQLVNAGMPEDQAVKLVEEVVNKPVKVEPVKKFDDPTSYIQ